MVAVVITLITTSAALLPGLSCSHSFCPFLARAREPWAGLTGQGEANPGWPTLKGLSTNCTLLCGGPLVSRA